MRWKQKDSAPVRLKTVCGHLDAVIGMVGDERYRADTMKQVSALKGSLEKVNGVLLQNHVETCDYGHCKTSLETDVGALEGVSRVEVSIEDRTIGVEFADGVTREEFVSAVEGQGYEVG